MRTPSTYLPRIIDSLLAERLETFGAVLIEGPKWCGKTTTGAAVANSAFLLSDPANDFSNRTLATIDPAQALIGANPRLVDEWQEVPKLWDAARFECDRRGEAGLFIFTGSATPRDESQPMHSGAGRFSRLRMGTMTLLELGASSGAVSLGGLLGGRAYATQGSLSLPKIAELVVRGGWPGAIGSSTKAAAAMALEYIDTIAEQDISEVDQVRRDPRKVHALIRSLARNESTLSSDKTLVADMGATATRQTVSGYLSVLERLHFTRDIPAWDPALRSPLKLRTARKRHLVDPSLAAVGIGADVDSLVADPKTLGLLFESLALHDLDVYAQAAGGTLYHYRDAKDLEADAIVALPNGTWMPIEVKLGAAQIPDAEENLLELERRMAQTGQRPPAAKCVIVGFGAPAHVTANGVQVIPLDTLGV